MKNLFLSLICILIITSLQPTLAQQLAKTNYDICIYGGTSSGLIAAYTARCLQLWSIPLTELNQNADTRLNGFFDQNNCYQ